MPRRPGGALAIDHGARRTGFAVSDPLRIASWPLEAFHGAGDSPELLEHVAALLEERAVGALVVGLPLDAAGGRGARAAEIERFVERLRARFPELHVATQDERLSTKAALDLLREAGHHGAARRARRDSWSALVILRDWIEAGEP